jgi:hypothetical protein
VSTATSDQKLGKHIFGYTRSHRDDTQYQLMAALGLNYRTGTTVAFIRQAGIRVRFARLVHQISN